MIKKYYSNKMIWYNMSPYLYKRTFDIICTKRLADMFNVREIGFRYRRVSKPDGLNYKLDRFEVKTKIFNLYASNALIDITKFPIISKNRDEAIQQVREITATLKDYITGYDLRVDIDNSDLMTAWMCAVKFKQFLDDHKIPYWLMFSGNKGFNFCIEDQYIPVKYDRLKLAEINRTLIENIGLHLKLKHEWIEDKETGTKKLVFDSLDTSVYTVERVFKVPYSIAREKNLVALPLTDAQFDHFDMHDYSIQNVMDVSKTGKLYNRGLLARPGSKDAVQELYKEFYENKQTVQKKPGLFKKIGGLFR